MSLGCLAYKTETWRFERPNVRNSNCSFDQEHFKARNLLAVGVVLLIAVSIVMLRPLELLHEAEALYVVLADLWITELPLHPTDHDLEIWSR